MSSGTGMSFSGFGSVLQIGTLFCSDCFLLPGDFPFLGVSNLDAPGDLKTAIFGEAATGESKRLICGESVTEDLDLAFFGVVWADKRLDFRKGESDRSIHLSSVAFGLVALVALAFATDGFLTALAFACRVTFFSVSKSLSLSTGLGLLFGLLGIYAFLGDFVS